MTTTVRNRNATLRASTALVPAAALLALIPSQAFAQDDTWDGEVSNDWETGSNWDGNLVPGVLSNVFINNGTLLNQPVIDLAQTAASTAISAGSLTVNASLTSPVTTSGTGILRINVGGQVTGTVTIGGTGTSSNAGAIDGALIVNGGIFNNSGFTSGATTLNRGNLNLNTGSNIPANQPLTINGGTPNVNVVEAVGTLSGTGGNINFGSGARLTVNQAVDGTYAGNFTGISTSGQTYFAKSGAGTLTLSGTSNVGGGGVIDLLGGRLVVQNGNAIGNSTIVIVSGGIFQLEANETIGALATGAVGIELGNFTLTLAGTGGSIGTNIAGVVSGTGGLTFTSSGLNTALSGENTYTGTTRVSAGLVRLGGSNRLATGSSLLVDGGTLNTQGFSNTLAGVRLDSGTINGGGTLTSTSDFDVRSGTIATSLAGNVGLNKTTAGSVTMSVANTYTGLTRVSAGTLNITNANALGTGAQGTIVEAGATLLLTGAIDEADQVFAAMRALPEPADHAGTELHAPVLVVPRVFEPELCRRLIDFYDHDGGVPSGTMRQVGGKTVAVLDNFKSRKDATIEDETFRDLLRARVEKRLIRQINRAFQFNPTRIERYIVACYDAEDGGYFRPHRDNTTTGTAHRKFACSINLNAEEFEGGDLRFPEFGPKTYRPPTGGAVVFSCSLLHEATPVTKGRRYAFLPFFFDEAGEELRQKNLHTLQLAAETAAASS
ncbi:MAG: 2OG-Fe(II) oxygenase [Porphyrobacter sp.]|nr:2OG-Fe(II) oxygenase [Porphyrobacter sp.]